jgi:hypothetical protein
LRRILVTGGRNYEPTAADVKAFLRVLHELTWGEPCEIGHGGCPTGVDRWIDGWARAVGIPVTVFPADWRKHGKAAGPIRNGEGVAWAGPTGACVPFPGGSGTADCERQARAAGLEVVRIDERRTDAPR